MGPNDDTKVATQINSLSEQIQHYYDTDGKLYRLPSNADLDNITESGRYYFGGNVTNKPASGGGYLDVYAYDTSWIKQVAYLEGSDAIYVRTKTGSSWSAWEQLAVGTEFNTVAISTLSALQTYLDNMPVGKTSTLILSGEASNAVCGSTYISNATVTKVDNGFADLRWSRANEDAGVARYQKTSQTFRVQQLATKSEALTVVDEKYVGANSSATFTLSNVSEVGFLYANNGNGTEYAWVVGARNNNELGVTPITGETQYISITKSGLSFTVACTYATRVQFVKGMH